jgi:hypothetical protein
MRSFKQYLLEEQEIDIPDEDKEWLYKKSQGVITKNSMGTLSANNNLSFRRLPVLKEKLFKNVPGGFELKYPFSLVDGSLDLSNCELVSFKNFPRSVNGSVNVCGNNISSIEGLPTKIESTLDISINDKLTSLSGIHKHLKQCLVITLPTTITSNVLGLVKIKDLYTINLDASERFHNNFETLMKVIKIVEKYIGGDGNVIECQKELYDNDLDEYAEV